MVAGALRRTSFRVGSKGWLGSDSDYRKTIAPRVARSKGTHVVLQLETAPVVERVIEVAGVDRHLVIARSRELAIAAARKQGGGDTSR